MKKWKNAMLVSIVMIIVLTTCACGSKAEKWQEQYDLGQQYLNDGNYEDAIIAYTEAIKIDEKQAPAYAGRGDAYNGLYTEVAENNYTPVNQQFAGSVSDKESILKRAVYDYSNAINIEPAVTDYYEKIVVAYIGLDDSGNIEIWLEQGYEQTQDSTLYENVIQIYIDAEDFDNAKHWLEKAYQKTKDENFNEKYEEVISQKKNDITNKQEDILENGSMITEEVFLYEAISYDDGNYSYHIPQLKLESDDAKFINEQIEESYTKLAESCIGNDGCGCSVINFKAYFNDNIGSLLIWSRFDGGLNVYRSYNIDVLSGKMLTNRELLKIAELSESEFLIAQNEAIKRCFIALYGTHDNVYQDNDYIVERYPEIYNKTISDSNNNIDSSMYLADNKELRFIGLMHSFAGPSVNSYALSVFDFDINPIDEF